jgi:hypothetical protein
MLNKVTYCFRLRFNLGDTSKLECEDAEWVVRRDAGRRHISLVVADGSRSIAEARRLALRGSGFATAAEAEAAGKLWRSRLMRAFACIRVGADFGDRASHGMFSPAGLAAFSASGQRSLNDVHGLMIFECEPAPVFVGLGSLSVAVSSPHHRLVEAVATAQAAGRFSAAEEVAYDLFSASFSQTSADARFALLMMALEALLEPRLRSEEARAHVGRLIEFTKASGLPSSEIDSMIGAIKWLNSESIGQTGRRVARTLEPRTYAGESPATFFTRCYELRSRLMHGHHPLPTRQDVDQRAAGLEIFVADLLCRPGSQGVDR